MAVRRDTKNRLTLIRTCGTCGCTFTTTADTPWVRQVPRDGKKQATTYYCSQTCHRASYKHLFNGKAEQRKKERDAHRDVREKNRRYYERHAEQERARQRKAYWSDPEGHREASRYERKKRKLLAEG